MTITPLQLRQSLATFDFDKIDSGWIRQIRFSTAHHAILNRITIGTAGYRKFKPFRIYSLRPRYCASSIRNMLIEMNFRQGDNIDAILHERFPERVLDGNYETKEQYSIIRGAYRFARYVAQTPVDWSIHPLTRDIRVT